MSELTVEDMNEIIGKLHDMPKHPLIFPMHPQMVADCKERLGIGWEQILEDEYGIKILKGVSDGKA